MHRLPLLLAGLLVASVVVVSVTAAAVVVRRGAEPPHAAPATAAVPAAGPAGSHALRVLHGWDERRALAWRRGSAVDVVTLYERGCPTARVDRAMLAAYRERGLRVVGLRRQTLAVRVLAESPRRVRMVVTDRLASATAIGHGVRQPLPRDGFTRRTLTFTRSPSGWVLAC